MSSEPALLEVAELSITFASRHGDVPAVRGVDLSIRPGETVALVGESGSGKSVTGLAIIGLVARPPGRIDAGSILWRGRDGRVRDLVHADERTLCAIRGNEIAMIFQEPMTSLNPVMRIGNQIAEAVLMHASVSRREARATAHAMLERVGIPDAGRRLDDYPHQLSGGMRQRVMIAMALACRPRLLIADEPTTALDVTIQAQILELIDDLRRELGMAVLFITHDLGVVATIADRVAVMYAGEIVEATDVGAAFAHPRHPYLRGLIGCAPSLEPAAGRVTNLEPIPGGIPDPRRRPGGCAFHPRCAHAVRGRCDGERPALIACADGTVVRCVRANELPAWTP